MKDIIINFSYIYISLIFINPKKVIIVIVMNEINIPIYKYIVIIN